MSAWRGAERRFKASALAAMSASACRKYAGGKVHRVHTSGESMIASECGSDECKLVERICAHVIRWRCDREVNDE
jgi:hypothetical protein